MPINPEGRTYCPHGIWVKGGCHCNLCKLGSIEEKIDLLLWTMGLTHIPLKTSQNCYRRQYGNGSVTVHLHASDCSCELQGGNG